MDFILMTTASRSTSWILSWWRLLLLHRAMEEAAAMRCSSSARRRDLIIPLRRTMAPIWEGEAPARPGAPLLTPQVLVHLAVVDSSTTSWSHMVVLFFFMLQQSELICFGYWFCDVAMLSVMIFWCGRMPISGMLREIIFDVAYYSLGPEI